MRYPAEKFVPCLASAPREARLAHEAERLRDGDTDAIAAQAGRLLGALLACMAGRAGPALLAEDALAVRLGAGQPAMLRTLLGALPADARARALASGRGEIFTALLERRDADDLLADLLGHIVAQGDPALAATLLCESRNLLFTAARGRRLEGALTPLLALAGPDFRAAIDGHRAALRRFSGPAAADVAP